MSHFGSAAKRLITSSAAVAFSSRTVTSARSRVVTIRFPVTSSASSRSSAACWLLRCPAVACSDNATSADCTTSMDDSPCSTLSTASTHSSGNVRSGTPICPRMWQPSSRSLSQELLQSCVAASKTSRVPRQCNAPMASHAAFSSGSRSATWMSSSVERGSFCNESIEAVINHLKLQAPPRCATACPGRISHLSWPGTACGCPKVEGASGKQCGGATSTCQSSRASSGTLPPTIPFQFELITVPSEAALAGHSMQRVRLAAPAASPSPPPTLAPA